MYCKAVAERFVKRTINSLKNHSVRVDRLFAKNNCSAAQGYAQNTNSLIWHPATQKIVGCSRI